MNSLENPALAPTLEEVLVLLERDAWRRFRAAHPDGRDWLGWERLHFLDLALEEVMATGRWPR